MRAEYIIAATLMGAALAVPAVLVGVMGDVIPGLSLEGRARGNGEAPALTLTIPPVMVPDARGVRGGAPRTVVVELDLRGRDAADRVCKAHPRLADRILEHMQDDGRGPTGPRGNDTRLAWLLDRTLGAVEIERAAVVESDDKRPRTYDRPLYRCNQGSAWPMP
ncbi:hypothetical protein KAJ83_05005 [Marivibrio halodurans]|uniref:Uncharacterized protein n=1 Tax=Marivibrio halodurans TaxID=2039722 RepID=A0A8J7V320_9PROT|nr:hypothetical protein [Marivibrio halodurans]MBP5856354.1 hypothetical protein [Marivibrio halodurans]